MRRALLLSLLILLAAPAAAHAATVRLIECAPALAAQERTATFEARMRPAHGSLRMQVRFGLQVREGELTLWRRVVAEGLDRWLTSAPGVGGYTYAKTVQNLAAPAAYRMVVRFRWLDADGAVVARSREVSSTCRQPDMRPDLHVAEVTAGPSGYAVTVRNGGRSAAGPFSVTLRVGDGEPAPQPLAELAPGETRVLTFAAPPCAAGTPLVATADADGAVDERDEDDNVLVASCAP
jgi:hypothetical protein